MLPADRNRFFIAAFLHDDFIVLSDPEDIFCAFEFVSPNLVHRDF